MAPDKREAGAPTPASRTTNYSRTPSVAAQTGRPKAEWERRYEHGGRARGLSEAWLFETTRSAYEFIAPGAPAEAQELIEEQADDMRSLSDVRPRRPWQEVPHYFAHSASFEECEREGQAWQLDLDAVCDRLDAGYRLCVAPGCREFSYGRFSKRGYCSKHEKQFRWLLARLDGRKQERADDEVLEPVSPPDELASDYYRQPETVSTRLSDPDRIRRELSYAGLSPSLLHAALNNKRWRTDEQRDMLDRLTNFMRERDVCLTALAAVIDCNRRTLGRMRGEGMTVMQKLDMLERQLERIEQATQELRDAQGLNPVATAERILADIEDELAA